MISSIEIPTANLRVSTMKSLKEVSPDDYDNDETPAIIMWLHKPQNSYIFGIYCTFLWQNMPHTFS